MKFELNETAGWTLAIIAAAIVCIVLALSSEGCQIKSSVTCRDGTSFSLSPILGKLQMVSIQRVRLTTSAENMAVSSDG